MRVLGIKFRLGTAGKKNRVAHQADAAHDISIEITRLLADPRLSAHEENG